MSGCTADFREADVHDISGADDLLKSDKKPVSKVDEIVRLHTDLEKEKRYEKVLETFQAVGLRMRRRFMTVIRTSCPEA